MAHWQEMVWLIGRRWHGSLAIDGVAHRQEMAWLTDRNFFFVAHLRLMRGFEIPDRQAEVTGSNPPSCTKCTVY